MTRTASLTVNPDAAPTPATPGAPTLLSPASNARVAQPINFDWSDVSGATSYEIQIDDSNNFTAPLTRSQRVSVSQATVTGLPAQRLFWRVRAFNSAGVSGPFSASRRFTAQSASTTPTTTSLSAVSVSPTSVVGGTTAQGTITLTGGAPSGGAVVTLSSTNTSIVSVPASVTVTGGASSATFGVNTAAVPANTAVTITATYGGVSRTTTLTVTPASTTNPLPAPSLVSPGEDARFTLFSPAGGDIGLIRPIRRFPFVPNRIESLDADCFEAFNIQVHGLRKRIKNTMDTEVDVTGLVRRCRRAFCSL